MSNQLPSSASKVVEVLFAFSLARPHLSAAEVADAVGINRTTAHRLLGVLEERGLVRRRPFDSTRYELTARVLQLSETFLHQLDDLRSVSMSHLAALRDRTGETAALHFRQGDARVGIVQVESHHQLRRTYADLGKRIPLYLGAPSLAMLAYLPVEQRERYFPTEADWPAFEARDSAHLEEWLAGIRQRGYAVSHAHRLAGIVSVAAPILGRGGDAIAAINVTGPAIRLNEARISEVANEVLQAARNITEVVGGGPRPDKRPPQVTRTVRASSSDHRLADH